MKISNSVSFVLNVLCILKTKDFSNFFYPKKDILDDATKQRGKQTFCTVAFKKKVFPSSFVLYFLVSFRILILILTIFQVFITVSQRDLHIRREHPNMSLSPTHDHNGSTSKLTTTKMTNPTSPASSSSPNNTPRIIVVKSPNKSQSGLTTILKKVEVIQPQKCPHCQEFISNMKAHVCELPWACKLCGKTYKLSSGLRKHCREGHGILVAVCEPCQITFMDGITGLEEHNREIHSRAAGINLRSPSSSPETFHGFTTPTKELEMTKRFETIILNLSDI